MLHLMDIFENIPHISRLVRGESRFTPDQSTQFSENGDQRWHWVLMKPFSVLALTCLGVRATPALVKCVLNTQNASAERRLLAKGT